MQIMHKTLRRWGLCVTNWCITKAMETHTTNTYPNHIVLALTQYSIPIHVFPFIILIGFSFPP